MSSKCQEDAAVQSDLKKWQGACFSSGSQLPCGITQCVRVCKGTFLTAAFLSKYVWKNKRSSSDVHSCANSVSPKGPQYVLYCVRYCFSVKVSYNPVGIYHSIHYYHPLCYLCFCMHLSTIFISTSKNTLLILHAKILQHFLFSYV